MKPYFAVTIIQGEFSKSYDFTRKLEFSLNRWSNFENWCKKPFFASITIIQGEFNKSSISRENLISKTDCKKIYRLPVWIVTAKRCKFKFYTCCYLINFFGNKKTTSVGGRKKYSKVRHCPRSLLKSFWDILTSLKNFQAYLLSLSIFKINVLQQYSATINWNHGFMWIKIVFITTRKKGAAIPFYSNSRHWTSAPNRIIAK